MTDEKRIQRIEALVAQFANLEGNPLDNALRLISTLHTPPLTYRFTERPMGFGIQFDAKVDELSIGYSYNEDGTINQWTKIERFGDTQEEAKASLDNMISKHYSIKRKMAAEGVLTPIDLEAFDIEHGLKEKITFSAQVLYNVGLGPEFFDIPNIEAINVDDAKVEAKKLANEKFGDGNWMEVKVKPIS